MASGSDETYSPGVAFGLWLGWLLGLAGLHRFYLGKPVTGVIYLLTWGLFGIGQVVDLIRLRRTVDDMNLLELGRQQRALSVGGTMRALPAAKQNPPIRQNPEEELRQALLKAAAARGGGISVAQAVMATGKSFEEIEKMLDDMAKKGYADIDNDPKSGVVIYHFGDLG